VLAISYSNLAHLYAETAEYTESVRNYKNAHRIAERLANLDPQYAGQLEYIAKQSKRVEALADVHDKR
jgi:hypothetical protein